MNQNPNDDQRDRRRKHEEEEDEDFLKLSLFNRSVRARNTNSSTNEEEPPIIPVSPPSMQMQMQMQGPLKLYVDLQMPSPNQQVVVTATAPAAAPPPPPAPMSGVRSRRNPTHGPREGKSEIIPPPFPWATNRRATIHTLKYLIENKIYTIYGDVQCKRCEKKYEMGFDLRDEFNQVWNFIVRQRGTMHDRAPEAWMNPTLPTCKHCGQENSAKPVVTERKKKSINWLFLLLGQLLGCCTLEQLKYFCKHTKNHRTGAKDRVLYLTYLALCKQLYPEGPFDR